MLISMIMKVIAEFLPLLHVATPLINIISAGPLYSDDNDDMPLDLNS